jgi:hypothetical protein
MTETVRPAAGGWRPAGIFSFLVVDVDSFSHSSRSDSVRVRVRKAMYEGLDWSLGGVELGLDDCYHEDRGDGVMVLVPPRVKAELLLTTVLDRLRTALRHHNEAASEAAQLRLRVAVHVGEAESDGHGIVSTALTHAFRLLDAEPLKAAVRAADTRLALVVSRRVYEDVVRHGKGQVDPGDYYKVEITVKETTDVAWITVPGVRPARPGSAGSSSAAVTPAESPTGPRVPTRPTGPPAPPVPVPLDGAAYTAELFRVVDDLLTIPQLRNERGRDQMVGVLSAAIAGAIPRSGEARADLFAIVQTCLDYHGGLQQLLQAVHGFVGESMAVQRLDRAIARLLSQPPPADLD